MKGKVVFIPSMSAKGLLVDGMFIRRLPDRVLSAQRLEPSVSVVELCDSEDVPEQMVLAARDVVSQQNHLNRYWEEPAMNPLPMPTVDPFQRKDTSLLG